MPETARAAATAPTMAMVEVSSILALQSVGDFTEKKRKAVSRGRSLLDMLEDMKADLLLGKVSAQRLDSMASQLSTLRERVDPSLDAVLDDIELRVLVELAKLGRFPVI